MLNDRPSEGGTFVAMFSVIIVIIISIIIVIIILSTDNTNVVMHGSHIPEHVSRDSRIPPASAYRK